MPIMIETGNSLYEKLKDKLDLGDNVLSLSIHLRSRDVATLVIERTITQEQGDELAAVLNEYKLHAKADDNP